MISVFTKRGILSVLFSLLMLVGASAQEFVLDGIVYSLLHATDGSVSAGVTGNENVEGDIVIPSTVVYEGEEYEVTEIQFCAFYNCSGLTSIKIPSSVTSIVDCAFLSCSSLASIETPSSVTSIGEYAFGDCSSLTSIAIPSSITIIGAYAFYGCTSLESVRFESPSSLTTIGGEAFNDCPSLGSIAVPPSVKEIGGPYAFDYDNFNTLVIPHSVEYMDDQTDEQMRPGTLIMLNSNDDILSMFSSISHRRMRCYSTAEVLDRYSFGIYDQALYTVSDVRKAGGMLSLALTDVADEVLRIRALEINGQRVEANESSTYTFENVGEGTEYELVVYADILDTEYPIYQTITVENSGDGVEDVKAAAGSLAPEVRGSLSEGPVQVRIPGTGEMMEWTLTAVHGATVAQGRIQADGSWQTLDAPTLPHGIYLLTVSDGQRTRTAKLVAH